jgi:hypothetical protein
MSHARGRSKEEVGATMKAIDRFKEFFKEEGIVYEEWTPYMKPNHGEDTILTVAQAHFLFKAGEYLGVKEDEMGGFFKKI